MISPKALQEFKEIWKEEKGEEISDELAREKATILLNAFDSIYRPIKKEWLEEFSNNSVVQTNDYEPEYEPEQPTK